MAPGVAWVSRAVVIAPVDMPTVSAISQSVVTALVFCESQSSRTEVWSMPITSLIVFTPAVIATALGALSVICASEE